MAKRDVELLLSMVEWDDTIDDCVFNGDFTAWTNEEIEQARDDAAYLRVALEAVEYELGAEKFRRNS